MIQVTYQKNDGTIIQRYRKTMLPYKIGDETSMRWKVLNIEYDNNNYYPEYEYDMMIHKRKQKYIRNNERRKMYMYHIITLMYYCAAIGIINLLKFILGL